MICYCHTSATLIHSAINEYLDPTNSEWADYVVDALCGNPSGKRAHTLLVRECLSTVIWSAGSATVD